MSDEYVTGDGDAGEGMPPSDPPGQGRMAGIQDVGPEDVADSRQRFLPLTSLRRGHQHVLAGANGIMRGAAR
jgi:hypothetical protein